MLKERGKDSSVTTQITRLPIVAQSQGAQHEVGAKSDKLSISCQRVCDRGPQWQHVEACMAGHSEK